MAISLEEKTFSVSRYRNNCLVQPKHAQAGNSDDC